MELHLSLAGLLNWKNLHEWYNNTVELGKNLFGNIKFGQVHLQNVLFTQFMLTKVFSFQSFPDFTNTKRSTGKLLASMEFHVHMCLLQCRHAAY